MECSVKDFLLFFFFTCPADDISCWTIFSYCFVVVFYYDLIFIRFEPLTICSTFPNVFQKDFRLLFPFVVVCCCYISFSEIYFRSDDERDVVPPFKIFSSLFCPREKKKKKKKSCCCCPSSAFRCRCPFFTWRFASDQLVEVKEWVTGLLSWRKGGGEIK